MNAARKNTSIKKLRQKIFGKRTERHQTKKAEGREKEGESETSDDGQPKASDDQDARAERLAGKSKEKPKRKGHGRRAASDYSELSVCRRPLSFWPTESSRAGEAACMRAMYAPGFDWRGDGEFARRRTFREHPKEHLRQSR